MDRKKADTKAEAWEEAADVVLAAAHTIRGERPEVAEHMRAWVSPALRRRADIIRRNARRG